MAGQHTPGPWFNERFDEDQSPDKSSAWVVESNGLMVAKVIGFLEAKNPGPEREQLDADIALITAAPDLLAACKAALQFVARHTPLVDADVPIVGEVADQFDAMAMQLRAAIARAEGGAA